MSFREELAKDTAEAEGIIGSFLPAKEGEAGKLAEAMNYSINAGGKRLRPVMMKMAYEMFGGDGEIIRPFMAAMEMIHTHSLIHDDLPAMDNDEYRRGKKTTHIVYGEAAAILAGDGLLNLAYETAAQALVRVSGDPVTAQRAARALAILSGKTGFAGMIGGQSVDVAMDGKKLTSSQLDFIYRLKTGALIEASLMIGAVLAGADEDQVRTMEVIGRKIGIAFQIRDDILDVTGDERELGKPTHSDERNEKTTYVTLYGLDKANTDVNLLTQEAMQLLGGLGRPHPLLPDLLRSLVQRTK